nr:zinc finger, CCHC-type [Tanacetum cinerariifolium]
MTSVVSELAVAYADRWLPLADLCVCIDSMRALLRSWLETLSDNDTRLRSSTTLKYQLQVVSLRIQCIEDETISGRGEHQSLEESPKEDNRAGTKNNGGLRNRMFKGMDSCTLDCSSRYQSIILSSKDCRLTNPTSGIKSSGLRVRWLSRIDQEGFVVVVFLEGVEGFYAWATRMTGAKFDIEKFDGTGDFRLWRIKMRALLIQHVCEAALKVLPADLEAQTKAELNKKAHSAVILCLGNKVLREVTEKTTTSGVCIIRTLCGYLVYGREALTLEDVMATLNSKKIKERSKVNGDDGEGLYVRGRTDREDSRQSGGKSRSKSRGDDGDERKAQALLDWIMDSGCPYHMTPRLDILFDFLECDGENIQLGDNMECKIRGIGKVRVQLKDGSSFVLHNVRYIPELKKNLISLGTLKKEGHTVKLQSGKVKVINGSRVILSGIRRDNCIYFLDGHAMAGELNASVEEKDSLAHVWHKRLGHFSEAGLQVLEIQGLFGKKSLGSDRLYSFRLMRSVSGRIINRTAKKLRTDNGLEFCNREFEQLCIESGIARHLTVSGTLQQNGVAEHMNITLMDKISCLLIQSGLPKTFWAEATCTAAYLINRSPSRAIEKKTPIEMWLGHPSDYGILRIFGCVTYLHDKQAHTNTLEEDQTNQEDGDDEDVGDQATDQPPDLIDYQLVRDREPRTRTKPLRFRDESNMVAYAFVAAEEEDTHEPLTYQEAVACEDSSKWKPAIKEEMDSLRKNKTWELVDHPAGKKLLDVKTTFLHGNLEEVIYMKQPPGYEQANKEFDIKELGEAKKILGMEIVRDRSRKIMRVLQFGYVSKILNNFRIDNGKSVKIPLGGHFKLSLKDCPVRDCYVERMSKVPYANAVGSLMYLMVCIRPDIAYAVSVVSRYLANPGFVDSDYAKDPYKGRAIIGYAFLVQGCVVSWKATLQHMFALSTIEEDYMALTEAVKEAIWLRGLLDELCNTLNFQATLAEGSIGVTS